ncbi:MAG: protein kinase [Planctomycetes bacterium]|nr:protein kinase [Planctomycetota bacterium]
MTGDADARLRRFLAVGFDEEAAGKAAVDRGYVTPGQMDECILDRERRRASGQPASLLQILLDRGILDEARFVELAALEGKAERRLGRYRLLREIGRGGMGVVWEAEDPSLRRRVALKIVRPAKADDELARRLHREGAIAARLRHPNIVAIHEVAVLSDEDGASVHVIAMDFIEGGTLAQVMAEGRASLSSLLRMLEEVARAVGYAHSQGVVHRDLKPANVLVDAKGAVTLTDFGLARAQFLRSRLTRSNVLAGTPHYMAPEQINGRADARSDVYALGVMLYEILAGRVPFQADTPVALFTMIAVEDPKPPRRPGRAPSRDLELICRKAMDKDPRRRYADATEFAEDVARFRNGEAVRARAPGVFYLLSLTIRRRRVAVIAVVAVAAAMLGVRRARDASALRGALERAAELEREGKLDEARDALAGHGSDAEARARLVALDRRRAKAGALVESGRREIDKAVAYQYAKNPNYEHMIDRVNEGQRLIEEAIALWPSMATAHYLLGRVWMIKGDDIRAEGCFRRAIEIEPGFGAGRYELGRALFVRACMDMQLSGTEGLLERGQERTEMALEATRELECAVASGWADDDLQRELAAAMMALARDDEATLRRITNNALRNYGGRLGVEEMHWLLAVEASGEEALKQCEMAIAECPGYGIARILRAQILWGMNRFEEALSEASLAVAMQPASGLAYRVRGHARLDLKDYDGAIVDFDRALSFRSGMYQTRLGRGIARERKGDREGAFSDFIEAIRCNPKSVLARVDAANILGLRGEADRALAELAEALRLNPTSGEAYLARAGLWCGMGNYDAAIADCARLLEFDDSNVEAHVVRARSRYRRWRALARSGRNADTDAEWDAAMRDCDEALRLDPRCVHAYYERAGMRYEKGDLPGALADSTRAIECNPSFANAYIARATVRGAGGDRSGALEDCDTALRLDPGLANAYVVRAEVRLRQGDRAGATADCEKSLEVARPGWENRGRAEELLRRLRR